MLQPMLQLFPNRLLHGSPSPFQPRLRNRRQTRCFPSSLKIGTIPLPWEPPVPPFIARLEASGGPPKSRMLETSPKKAAHTLSKGGRSPVESGKAPRGPSFGLTKAFNRIKPEYNENQLLQKKGTPEVCPGFCQESFSNACFKSAIISSTSSMPTDIRIMFGSTPHSFSCCSFNWRWVVLAGWQS